MIDDDDDNNRVHAIIKIFYPSFFTEIMVTFFNPQPLIVLVNRSEDQAGLETCSNTGTDMLTCFYNNIT